MKLELSNGIRLTVGDQAILFGAGFDGGFFPYSRAEKDAKSSVLTDGGSFLRYELRETANLALEFSFCMEKAPHSVNVLFHGAVNFDGVFRQGFGIGGPSGYLEEGAIKNICPLKSHGLIAFRFGENYLCIYAGEVTKYRTEFDISTCSADGQKYYLSVSYITECVEKEDKLPALHFIEGRSLEDVLKQAAREIAAPFLSNLREPAYHWCSWYYYYNNLDLSQLAEFLDGLKTIAPLPLKYIQIDAGYFPAVGDWSDDFHLFPGGIKRAAELIRSRGYRPGIWIAPYMVGCRSRLFREHPDWVLKNKNGSYLVNAECFNEPKLWGYQDEEYYVLDTSHPEAMEYIRSVFRTFREWGFELFKTDFMLWGLRTAGMCCGRYRVRRRWNIT
ncbi:MAG: alpha-galactosidase, partial [Oscillospiraceae bacterium]|nr:alpha-galactosidase [Oscillospiraceae bacterium]